MAKMKYDESDIRTLSDDRERVRYRPTIYVPSKDERGALHIIFEAIDNAIDELMRPGSVGDTVTITFDDDTKECSVVDNGAGIPQGKLLEVITTLNSSGKYGNNENTVYTYSGGINGVGTCLQVYLSEYCSYCSIQKGKSLKYVFKDGLLIDTIEEKAKGHGTEVVFKIDSNLISTKGLSAKDLVFRCEEKAFIVPKVKIVLNINKNGVLKKSYKYHGKNIVNRVELMEPDTDIVYGKGVKTVDTLKNLNGDLSEDTVPVEFALAFKDAAIEEPDKTKYVISYGNTVKTYTGGVHVDGLQEAVVKFYRNDLFPELSKRNQAVNVIPADIYGGLCMFVITQVHEPEFRGQFKDSLQSPEAKRATRDVVYEALQNSSPAFRKQMSSFVLSVARGRIESKKTRTRNKDVSNAFSKDRVDKYFEFIRDATTFEPELILCEGKVN